ncbi:MAG: hypothetical protein KJ737_16290 [Proteobacteria bacterium]|nr:hypothetical protein [Pseudomonadota bacterium]
MMIQDFSAFQCKPNPAHLCRTFITFIAILIFLSVVFGCSTGSKKNDSGSQETYGAELVVGPSGGHLSITDTESTLYRVGINIPEGALSEDKKVTLSALESQVNLPYNYIQASRTIDFGPDGTLFNIPVEITLPYKDNDNDGIIDGTYLSETGIGALFYNDAGNGWEAVTISNVDTVDNTVTVMASHFTLFLVFVDPQGTGADTEVNLILPGEYFVGEPEFLNGNLIQVGCINRQGARCGNPYYLTVRHFDNINPAAVIDRFPTTNTGPAATIDDDGMSATFDADQIFEKVLRSGSATMWQWESEFNVHTRLWNFDVLDDENVVSVNGIYSSIEVLANGQVKISWGFDIFTKFIIGDQVVIAFEAYYK